MEVAVGCPGRSCTDWENPTPAGRVWPACRKIQPRISARPAGVPTYCGGTSGWTKSGNLGVDTIGSATRLGARAPTDRAVTASAAIAGHRITKILTPCPHPPILDRVAAALAPAPSGLR